MNDIGILALIISAGVALLALAGLFLAWVILNRDP